MLFAEGGGPSVERGDCLLREGAVYQRGRPFVEGGGHLLRGEAICQGREGAGCQRRRPFIERGDHSPFVDRRMLFVHGRRPFVEGGGSLSLMEEAVCRGRASMWWKGRTMKFHIGKFKIQHDHMISEFQWT